ncbi:MAG: spore coat protein U domain-containing protein [Aestuariivirga sp.]
MRKYLLPVAGLAFLAASNGAFAAQGTANFNVKVQVTAACTVSAADLNFGNFAGSIPLTTVTTNATVTCNVGVPYTLSLTAAGLGSATALMSNGSSTISAALTVPTTSKTATGGGDLTAISGTVGPVASPQVGNYTIPQAIYVNY